MPVSMNVEPSSCLLVFSLSGMTSQEQLEEMMRQVVQLREETGFSRVLLNVTERKESLGLLELFEVGQALADPAFNGLRVAIFSAVLQPGIEFACTVASGKRCGADLRTFVSEQAARGWLLSSQTSAPKFQAA